MSAISASMRRRQRGAGPASTAAEQFGDALRRAFARPRDPAVLLPRDIADALLKLDRL